MNFKTIIFVFVTVTIVSLSLIQNTESSPAPGGWGGGERREKLSWYSILTFLTRPTPKRVHHHHPVKGQITLNVKEHKHKGWSNGWH